MNFRQFNLALQNFYLDFLLLLREFIATKKIQTNLKKSAITSIKKFFKDVKGAKRNKLHTCDFFAQDAKQIPTDTYHPLSPPLPHEKIHKKADYKVQTLNNFDFELTNTMKNLTAKINLQHPKKHYVRSQQHFFRHKARLQNANKILSRLKRNKSVLISGDKFERLAHKMKKTMRKTKNSNDRGK